MGVQKRRWWPWTWPLVIVLSALAAGFVSYGDVHAAVRPYIVFWFLAFCPGLALVRPLGLSSGVVQGVLAVALSLTLDTLAATIARYAGLWSPQAIITVLFGITLAGLVLDAALTLRGGDRGKRMASDGTYL